MRNPYENDGPPADNPFDVLKRKNYLIGSLAGVASILLVWAATRHQKVLSGWDLVVLPCLAGGFLVLAALLWRRIIRMHTFELAVYILAMLYAVSEFIDVLTQTILTQATFTTNFTLWIPFTYILAFLLLDTRRALTYSIAYLVTILGGGLTCLFCLSIIGVRFPDTTLLIQMYVASAFYIVILYLTSKLHEQHSYAYSSLDSMSRLAMTDALTKVYNRRLLDRLIRQEINQAERHPIPLSLMLFDLDHFKKINDTHGHNIGDLVLQEVAQLLRQSIRSSDPFGRWGGDEFLCLATNTDGKQAAELAERLRDALEEHQFIKVKKVTASFGVTTYQRGDTPETLVRRADMGLYKAKGCGRNRVEVVIAGTTLPLFEGEKPYAGTQLENELEPAEDREDEQA